MKNKKVMSLAIRPELHEEVKKVSKRKGMSTSEYIGNLVEQAVKLNPDEDILMINKPLDEEVTSVVLNIPVKLKPFPDQLEKWLSVQIQGIAKAMKLKDGDVKPSEELD